MKKLLKFTCCIYLEYEQTYRGSSMKMYTMNGNGPRIPVPATQFFNHWTAILWLPKSSLEVISAYWSKISPIITTSMCNTKFQWSFKTWSAGFKKKKTWVRMFISDSKPIRNFGTLLLLDFLALFPPHNCCFAVLKLWMKYIFVFRLLDLPLR